MPQPMKHESRNSYMKRCMKEVMAEGGHTQSSAVGKCLGMFNYYTAKKTTVNLKGRTKSK